MTKGCKISEDEILLPEPMIQHIQSFLTGKEAARTTVLSKSWYTAWLTRPTFDFDQRDFNDWNVRLPKIGFAEAMTKNMQRYQDSNMKIDSFRLRFKACYFKSSEKESENLANKLIASALKSGAKDFDLDLRSDTFVLSREVLQSDQIVRLSLSNTSTKMIDLSGMNMFKLHNLRRLCLKKVRLDPLFFSDFASRFPCLKDLSVSDYRRYRWNEAIRIASTSLERISFVKVKALLTAEFDVPNLVSFRYSGEVIPSLHIESSREWESDVSTTTHIHSNSCYLQLKNLLTQLRPSKISLSMDTSYVEGRRDIKITSSKPVLVVENLTIDPPYRSGYTFLSGLLSICRPKFLTTYWSPYLYQFTKEDYICRRVMEEIITPNCEISDQNMFGQLGLKEASVEVLDVDLEDPWLPLFLNEPLHALTTQKSRRKLRFRLRWG